MFVSKLTEVFASPESAIKAIVKEVDGAIPIQLGGGIRNLDTVEK